MSPMLSLLIGAGLVLLTPSRWRPWALFGLSVVMIYTLQPTLNIRWLDYSLPTLTLLLTVGGWIFSRERRAPSREDALALAVIVGIIALLTLPRYVLLPFSLTSRPPEFIGVAVAVVGVLAAITALRAVVPARFAPLIGISALVGLFIAFKTPALATLISGWLRINAGQDAALASPLDLEWIGFSYVAFRLIHTLRDSQTGQLPALSLREYVTYVLFFPSYLSGPIDRAERFTPEYRALSTLPVTDADRITRALTRIVSGVFKKFIIADSLAVFSLNPTLAAQADSIPALWLMLYAYAFRLYFDFSGYTEIAIGIAQLLGFNLPENFAQPYRKNTLAAFWQSWHITLSQWVRFYVYSPLSRALLRRKTFSNEAIFLICNLVTMGIIGLWHGVTGSFLVWGVWHGLGLTAHKLWSDRTRARYRKLTPPQKRLWHAVGVVLTFQFVVLGWVWFALPDITQAQAVFFGLFGR